MTPRKTRRAVDSDVGKIVGATILSFKNTQFGLAAPIIIDLDGDGVEMRSIKKSKAHFDMDGDGRGNDTGWVGKGDAFLALDRNGNDLIDDVSEISFLGDKEGATSDLAGLTAFDGNKDGRLDRNDAKFGEFRLWADRNDNGLTDNGELVSLDEAGISKIGLTAHAANGTAKIGQNIVLNTALFERSDGSTGAVGDVVLAFKPNPEEPASLARTQFSAARLQELLAKSSLDEDAAHNELLARVPIEVNNDNSNAELLQLINRMAAFGGDSGAASLGGAVSNQLARQLELLTASHG